MSADRPALLGGLPLRPQGSGCASNGQREDSEAWTRTQDVRDRRCVLEYVVEIQTVSTAGIVSGGCRFERFPFDV